MRRDLTTHDAFNSRLVRLTHAGKARDTDQVLGSDVMVSALEGYTFLKIAGHGEGLNGLRRDLGKRFEMSRPRQSEPDPVVVPV